MPTNKEKNIGLKYKPRFLISKGVITTVAPNTKPVLTITEPKASPKTIDLWPIFIDLIAKVISGKDVPKATPRIPIIAKDKCDCEDISPAEKITPSALKRKSINEKRNMLNSLKKIFNFSWGVF